VWVLFVEAKTWNCRPSDLLAIEDDYVAYCLDQAVGYLGRTIESELNKVEGKTEIETEQKRKIILDRFLGEESDKPRRGLYADPAAMM
jgi:hypothetical protein